MNYNASSDSSLVQRIRNSIYNRRCMVISLARFLPPTGRIRLSFLQEECWIKFLFINALFM